MKIRSSRDDPVNETPFRVEIHDRIVGVCHTDDIDNRKQDDHHIEKISSDLLRDPLTQKICGNEQRRHPEQRVIVICTFQIQMKQCDPCSRHAAAHAADACNETDGTPDPERIKYGKDKQKRKDQQCKIFEFVLFIIHAVDCMPCRSCSSS